MKLLYLGIILLSVLSPEELFAFPADFDGDGRSDPAVFRPSNGTWYVFPSSGVCPPQMQPFPTFGGCYLQWGLTGDQPVTGDYEPDGRADFTVRRPSDQKLYIRYSSGGSINFPFPPNGNTLSSDILDEADFNGDGRSDVMLFRPSIGQSFGTWFIRVYTPQSGIIVSTYQIAFNVVSQDPVDVISANYAGPLVNAEPANFVRFIGGGMPMQSVRWCRINTDGGGTVSSCDPYLGVSFANKPGVGNYGGVAAGLADRVRWDPPTGNWHIAFTGGSPADQIVQWGLNGDIPVPGYFDSDSLLDLAVWRPSTGTWFVLVPNCPPNFQPTGFGGCFKQWGLNGDIPLS